MRRPMIAGNWKMNTDRKSAATLINALKTLPSSSSANIEIVVCPPFPYLGLVVELAQGSAIQVGGQNASNEAPGAFTGETACEMLRDVGCSWVILGHSERRQLLNESDAIINRKAKKSLATGLKTIVCVGELLAERESNQTESVLDRQMSGSLADLTASDMANVVIAYEPVWAIGTGKVATNEQAESTHAFLRAWLARRFDEVTASQVRIVYGGSVKADNADGLLGLPNVDGALVGGASLKADSFGSIIDAGIRSVARP